MGSANADSQQPAAAGEHRIPDARHAVRDRHARQAAATPERIRPDARHRLAAERGGNRHGTCRRWRDGGRRITFVNLRRVVVDLVRPCIVADRFRIGPCGGRRGNRRKQRQIADGSASRPCQHHQFRFHILVVPFKSLLLSWRRAGRLAPPDRPRRSAALPHGEPPSWRRGPPEAAEGIYGGASCRQNREHLVVNDSVLGIAPRCPGLETIRFVEAE